MTILLQSLLTLFTACTQSNQSTINPIAVAEMHIEVLAENLEVPWGMDFLPDGRLLFTERTGKINMLDIANDTQQLLMDRKNKARAEGGLLGLAVDPDFENTGWIFIYETAEAGNRIVRLHLDGTLLTENKTLCDNIPAAMFHDGGILVFGPDGYLYAGTGDARDPESAQDLNSNAGKVLRMDKEGNAVADNPFGNLIYSYGHRNVQGIAWDNNGNMFATEHGPSGEINGWCCHDELNKIIAGGNYGWPLVIGDSNKKDMIAPLAHSGDDTWAPGGISFIQNMKAGELHHSILMACLRGRKLIAFQTDGNTIAKTQILFDGTYKRLRNIVQAPDGSILFCSSNMDGRESSPLKNDDKIYRIKFAE